LPSGITDGTIIARSGDNRLPTDIVSTHSSTSSTSVSRWLTFPAAIGVLLFLVVFFNSVKGKITEPDSWWHLRNAQHIVATHSQPRFDEYSFTVAGAPWIDHEWLSELAYYCAFRALGLRGLFALYCGLSAAIFVALYYRCRQEGSNPKTAAIVLLLGILLASVSFGPRPLLFGWLCLTFLLILLERFASTGSSPLWIMPPLFCLWINLHGSWLFGLITVGVFVVAGFIQGEFGMIESIRLTAKQTRKLLIATAASVAALFINPFGYKLVAYPFDLMFRQKSNLANIAEWQSVDFHDFRGKLVMLLLLGVVASMLFSRKRWKLHEVLLTIFALYVSLMYWRMQFFGALVVVPILAARLTLFPPYDVQKEKPILNGIIIAGAVALMLLRFPSEAQLNQQLHDEYPSAALAHMRTRGITERVFNSYGWGGYMVWHAPEIKIFIDGRADLFVYKGVFDDYVKIIHLQNSLELLDRYKINNALLEADMPLAYLLGHDTCWNRVYADKVAVVYQRQAATAGCIRVPIATK
jgi:hypothetical protein